MRLNKTFQFGGHQPLGAASTGRRGPQASVCTKRPDIRLQPVPRRFITLRSALQTGRCPYKKTYVTERTVGTICNLCLKTAHIKEVKEGIWIVSFMHYDLGFIDLEQKTLQPLDNLFGLRLSPMS